MKPKQWNQEISEWQTALRGIGRSKGTVRLRVAHLRQLRDWAGARQPGSLKQIDLLAFMGSFEWEPETRNSVRASVRGFYSWRSIKHGVNDPAAGLPSIKRGRPVPRPAAESAYRQALRSANPREQLMLRLSATCGLRRAEVAKAHSEAVFEDLGGGFSLQVKGKGGFTRFVPLPDSLAIELLALPSGYFFPGQRDGHLSPEHVGRLISRLLPDGVTMHMLRHRFATLAYQVDKDLFAVQDLLGHQSPVTTRNYVLTDSKAGRRLVDIVAAA